MASATPNASGSGGDGSRRVVRKRISIDLDRLERAMAVLGCETADDVADRALDLVLLDADLEAALAPLAAAGVVAAYFEDDPARLH